MSSNRSKRHIHKYYRASKAEGFPKLWACADPECNHHMPEHMAHLVEGKASFCWGCNQKMFLDPQAFNMDRPECPECRLGVKNEDLNGDDVSIRLKKLLEGIH